MIKFRWLVLITASVVLIASIGAFLDARNTISTTRRGWVDATTTDTLPLRPPLAGINVELTHYTTDKLDEQLDAIDALGFYWLRQPIYWAEIEPEEGVFDWAAYDAVVKAVADHPGLSLVLVLDGTPSWARHTLAPEHPFAPPASVQAYADFAGEVAKRYGESVDVYQIWDEPNIRTHWGNMDPRPAMYVAMLQQSYNAIHKADSEAEVLLAALAPNVETGPENLSDILFLQAVYDLGGQEAFDGAAAKPYGFDYPPTDRTVDAGTLNFSRIILLREEMVRRGDSEKQLWASNFGWNHLPNDWTGPPSIWGQVDAAQQSDYTYAAFDRAEREWPWLGGLILQHWEPAAPADDPIQGFAIAPHAERWPRPVVRQDGLTAGHYVASPATAEFDGYWQFGVLGADAMPDLPENVDPKSIKNTITVDFYGTAFGINVRKDDYLAYLTVTIDGENANLLPVNNQDEAYIVLTSKTREPVVELVPVARNLAEGKHQAIITHQPAQGDDRWSIVGFAVGSEPDLGSQQRQRTIALFAGMISLIVVCWFAWGLSRRMLQPPSRQSLIDVGDWLLVFITSTILIIGVVLSLDGMINHFLRRDPPAFLVTITALSVAYFSPTIWAALIGLVLFAIIVFNRPIMGVLAVVFWSVFFTATLDIHIRLIAVLEVMLAISLAAITGRQLFDLASTYRDHPLSWRQWIAKIKISRADLAIIVLVTLAVVSLTWADLLPEAFRELRTMILGPAILYWLLRSGRLGQREWSLVIDVVVIGGLTIALTGLYNYITEEYVVYTEEGTRRLIGVYGSPNSVALHLGRVLPFAVTYALFASQWRRLYGGIAALVIFTALLLTQSIGALVMGLPAALAVIMIAWQGRRALLPLAALGIGGLLALIPLSRFVPRLQNLTDLDSNTTLFRVNLWRSTFEMLKDHPLEGVGLDQFLYAYRGRYILPEAWADPDLSHPHNWILDYWVRLGIAGVVLGIWLQFIFWRYAIHALQAVRDRNRLKMALVLGAMGSMANFLAHGMVDSAYFAINLSYIFMINLALVQWAAKKEQLMQYILNDVTVNIVQDDITQLETDAITNAANSDLILGAGVAGAIRRAGGPNIQKECNHIGHCDVGDAVITSGGNLKADHVIHAVGPRMGEGDEHAKLASTVRAVYRVANENHLESVALPAISTGVFGFPLADAATIFAEQTLNYARQHTTKQSLNHIVLCLYDQQAYDQFIHVFRKVWPSGEDF